MIYANLSKIITIIITVLFTGTIWLTFGYDVVTRSGITPPQILMTGGLGPLIYCGPYWFMHRLVLRLSGPMARILLSVIVSGIALGAILFCYIALIDHGVTIEHTRVSRQEQAIFAFMLVPFYSAALAFIVGILKLLLARRMTVDNILKIGHRGAPSVLPENTVASFKKAIRQGAEAVELDVHLSKDGEIIVIHDETVDRTTNSTGRVADMTLAELKMLAVKGGGSVPTLREVIEALGKHIIVFIEIKSPSCGDKVIALVREFVSQGWSQKKLWIISFDHALMKRVKEQAPEILTCATTEKMPSTLAQFASDASADGVTPCIHYLTEEFVADAKARGLKLFVWTANTPEAVSKARILGVDGIMTDRLELLA